MNALKKTVSFFKYTHYRLFVFVGCFVPLLLVSIFAENIRLYYFPEGNFFRHFDGNLTMHVIDVGHGDAIAIRFPDNRVALIDGGSHVYYRRVSNYLRTRVVGRNRQIDWLINTNPRAHHVGTLPQILESFNVVNVLRPPVRSLSSHDIDKEGLIDYVGTVPTEYTHFIDKAHSRATNVETFYAGMTFGAGTFRVVFHTPTPDYGLYAARGNLAEVSPVITIQFGNQVFVLTGGAGWTTENSFASTESARKIFDGVTLRTVHLKAGNHAHERSNSALFLDLVQPTTVSVSAGTLDWYLSGYTLGRLRGRAGSNNVFITRDVGHIAIRTNGDDYRVFTGFQNPPNLWWLFAVLVVILAFLCFFNFERKKGQIELETKSDCLNQSSLQSDE